MAPLIPGHQLKCCLREWNVHLAKQNNLANVLSLNNRSYVCFALFSNVLFPVFQLQNDAVTVSATNNY